MTEIAFRLLVTGHRRTTFSQAQYVRAQLGRLWLPLSVHYDTITVVDGQCPYGGVDEVAHLWAEERDDAASERHPMRFWVGGPGMTGPQRNQAMVDLGADLCMGFPGRGSRGTWDCLRKACDAGIPTITLPLHFAGGHPPAWPTLEVR